MSEVIASVAEAFVSARRETRGLPVYPGPKPDNLNQAYAIQDRAIALDGRNIAGWKVGRIPEPRATELGFDRLAGPIFDGSIISAAAGEVPAMPIFADGFGAAEAEFLIQIKPGRDGVVPRDDAETLALISDVRIGIEVASSPYVGINNDGPAVTISDFGNNYGVVLGNVVEDWKTVDLCAVPIVTLIDGTEIGAATAATMLDGPLGAVRFLLAHLVSRGISYNDSIWVSTGAVTGVHPVQPGQLVETRFGAYGSVLCSIVPAKLD